MAERTAPRPAPRRPTDTRTKRPAAAFGAPRAAKAPHSRTPGSAEKRSRTRLRRRRVLLGVFGVLALMAVVTGVSWAKAVSRHNQESFAAKNAEWMRGHNLGRFVDKVELYQYTHNQPKDGGTPSRALIATTTTPAVPATIPAPAPMPSAAAVPFGGEGVWTPAGRPTADGGYGVYTTRVRPNATKTSLVVFVARIDPTRSRVRIIPGSELPGGSWSHPPQILPSECSSAILAVNGGFRFDQSRGGWYSDGRPDPHHGLVNGAASIVLFKDGTMALGKWGRDITNADLPRILTVRQNLELMVDQHHVDAHIDDGPKWGAQLPNSLFIWRSGYGITADGKLLYIGGPGLTPRDLAERLIDAGAVRGMQGDINPEWVASNLYHSGSGGCHGTKGLDVPHKQGGQQSSGDRYLAPDTRDFIAVFNR